MPIPNHPTKRQEAYALHLLGSKTRKEAALKAGYPVSTAEKAKRLEQSEGFKIAMSTLCSKTGEIALAALFELQRRGFEKMSDTNLLKGITALSSAYEKFKPKEKESDQTFSQLRSMLMKAKAIDADAQIVQHDNVIDVEVSDGKIENMFDVD